MMNPSPKHPSSFSTSLSLVDRVRANDSTAWQRLVDLYGPLVFGWGCRARLTHEDAADVMQEVFLSVSKAILRFDPVAEGRFRGWLWTITRNKLRDHYRRKTPMEARGGDTANYQLGQLPAEEFPERWEDGASAATRHEVQALYHRAMMLVQSDFEPQTWQAFWLAVVEEKSTQEIADLLGLTANGVRQAKSRVLRRLRAELSDTR
jgi:RNA polymerase sigma-70 factor (ECF subfamily)